MALVPELEKKKRLITGKKKSPEKPERGRPKKKRRRGPLAGGKTLIQRPSVEEVDQGPKGDHSMCERLADETAPKKKKTGPQCGPETEKRVWYSRKRQKGDSQPVKEKGAHCYFKGRDFTKEGRSHEKGRGQEAYTSGRMSH